LRWRCPAFSSSWWAVLHPNIFHTGFVHAALHSRSWVTLHLLTVAAMVLSLFGVAGLYADRAQPDQHLADHEDHLSWQECVYGCLRGQPGLVAPPSGRGD
jgi:hypothetical protein